MKKGIITLIFILTICMQMNSFSFAQQSEIVENFYKMHPIINKESSFTITTIDPKLSGANSYYPGQRGPNQLIIYTPSYSFARTGTNEFGSEAVVVDGIVCEINGADSLIPQNGFVVSGHGKAKKWINENLTIGSNVIIDLENYRIYSFTTAQSFTFNAKQKLKETEDIINYYSQNDSSYDAKTPKMYIKKCQTSLENAQKTITKNSSKEIEDMQKNAQNAIQYANFALESAIPFKQSEFKGIWIRPTQKTRDEVAKTLDKLKKAGIENIFLETFYHGKTIYPSKVARQYGFIEQNENFYGFDPLEAFIKEAHARDMKLHVWFETFYVGNKKPSSNPKHILNVCPSWANVTKALYASSEPVPSLSEHNGYFLDPANENVTCFLLQLIKEISNKYHPDGINLDYIRYPQTIAKKYAGYERANWGYTQSARTAFFNLYGKDPLDISVSDPMWDLWAKFRQNKISDFICQASHITKPKKIMLTAIIFPDRQKSLDIKMQDWKKWADESYLDALIPLILTCDKNTASFLISDIKNNARPKTKIFCGLFVPFMQGNPDDMLRIIHQARKLNTNGIVIFDYNHFLDKYANVLSQRVFNPKFSSLDDNNEKNTNIKKQLNEKQKQKKRKFFKKRKK